MSIMAIIFDSRNNAYSRSYEAEKIMQSIAILIIQPH